MLLNPRTAWELKEAGMVAVDVPMNFATPERPDALRNASGAFDSSIKMIND